MSGKNAYKGQVFLYYMSEVANIYREKLCVETLQTSTNSLQMDETFDFSDKNSIIEWKTNILDFQIK